MSRLISYGKKVNLDPLLNTGSIVSKRYNTVTEMLGSADHADSEFLTQAYIPETKSVYCLIDPQHNEWLLLNTNPGAIVVDSPSNTFDASALINGILANSTGVIALAFVAGKNYNFSAPITLPVGTLIVHSNGAIFTAQYGSQWSTPIFQNNKVQDQSHSFIINAPTFLGNCVAIDMRYQGDNPNAGLSLSVNNLKQNTMDGSRKAGTATILLSHNDFLDINKTNTYNVDQIMVIGTAPPKRTNTQLSIRNVMGGQVNGGIMFRGADKVIVEQADIANCGNGFSFEGNNNRISMLQCHVEGLARNGFQTQSSYIHASSVGVGYNFVNDTDNRVIMTQCSLINLNSQNSGPAGTAAYGIRLGVSSYPGIMDVECVKCSIPESCEGSTSYKPGRFYAPVKWRGKWTFTASTEMSANGLGYLDHDITESDNNYAPRTNLLGGSTLLSLRTVGEGTAPTITEEGQSSNPMYLSHRILFNSVAYVYNVVNLPLGWCTLDVVGQRIAGNVLLRVQQSSGAFAMVVNVQYKSLNNDFHRTRIVFYNPTANLSYRVGLASQNASGDEAIFSYIACYAGLPDYDIRPSKDHVVTALPTASSRWRHNEMVVVAAGAEDAVYRCLLQSTGNTYAWKRITLT